MNIPNIWKTIHIRVRSDQKEALDKKYHDNLSKAIRDLIDAHFKLSKPDEIILNELEKKIEAEKIIVASLSSQKNQLLEKQDKRKSSLEFETLRNDYLKDHPRTLLDFSRNMVTTTGYDTIRYKLRFDSVKDLKVWLNEKLTEAKKSPEWEKHLTDRVNQQNGLKCFSQTMHKPETVLPEKFRNKKEYIL